jgi:hypothetical protein
MGFLVDGQCLSTKKEALDLYYTAVPPATTAGATSYQTTYTKSGSQWLVQTYQFTSAGSSSLVYSGAAPVPSFTSCDETAAFFDGMEIGWAIATAMIAVYALKMIGRAR